MGTYTSSQQGGWRVVRSVRRWSRGWTHLVVGMGGSGDAAGVEVEVMVVGQGGRRIGLEEQWGLDWRQSIVGSLTGGH